MSIPATTDPTLSRRSTLPLGIGFLLLCMLFVGAPMLLLTTHLGLRGIVDLMHEGGPTAMALPLLHSVVLIALAVMGFVAIVGRRIPAAAVFLPALAPLLVGIAGTIRGVGIVEGVLPVVDPSMRDTLFAKGLSESISPLLIGTLDSGFALLAAAVMFAFAHLALDPRKLTAENAPATAPSRSLAGPALATGLFAFAVSVGARFLLGAGASLTDLPAWFAIVFAVAFAPLAAASLSRLPDNEAGIFAWRNAAHVLPALAGSVALFGYSGMLLARHFGLAAIAGVDPSMKGIILASTAAAVRIRPALIAIDVACATVATALVVSRAASAVRRPAPFSASAIITVLTTLVVASGLLWFEQVNAKVVMLQFAM